MFVSRLLENVLSQDAVIRDFWWYYGVRHLVRGLKYFASLPKRMKFLVSSLGMTSLSILLLVSSTWWQLKNTRYLEVFGPFPVRLVTFYTDVPVETEGWKKLIPKYGCRMRCSHHLYSLTSETPVRRNNSMDIILHRITMCWLVFFFKRSKEGKFYVQEKYIISYTTYVLNTYAVWFMCRLLSKYDRMLIWRSGSFIPAKLRQRPSGSTSRISVCILCFK